MPYLFVTASVIAVLAISFILKWNMDKIKYDPENIEKAQMNLILGASISEIIPIILVVIGFAKMEQGMSINDLMTPFIIVLLLMGFAVTFSFLQMRVGTPDKIKGRVQQLGMVGLGLALPMPIISLVAFITMLD